MSDIARRDEHVPATHQPSPAATLVAWADGASAAARLATPLVNTDFVPKHFKGNVTAATAAILFGSEIGLSPMQSLQGIYVIGGKPALYARVMLAVVLSAGHRVWTQEATDSRVIVCGQRRGQETVEKAVWTTDRAKQAGFTSNANYRTSPQAMLLARAQSDICRRVAPDALLGIAYSVEELELAEQAEPAPTAKRARRTPAPVEPTPVDEPSLEPAATPEPAAPVAGSAWGNDPELDFDQPEDS